MQSSHHSSCKLHLKKYFLFLLHTAIFGVTLTGNLLNSLGRVSNQNDYGDDIKRYIFEADLVVFDEIGTKSLTTWEHEHILNLVNTRIDMDKSNIYTSNLTSRELREKVGDRLYSRIMNLSVDIELFGTDKRGVTFE